MDFRTSKNDKYINKNQSGKKELNNLAYGHKKDSLGRFVNADNFLSSNYTIWLGNRKGPGRISSNVFDLLLWDQALYGETLVTKSTLDEAFTPYKLNSDKLSFYGFGWRLNKDLSNKIVSHSGSNPGYKTRIVRLLDKKRTILVLSNNDFKLESLINKLTNLLSK